MKPVSFGLLSTARINSQLLAAARSSPLAEVAAVASRDATRAVAYAATHGIPTSYGSYQQLLADDEIEAVYVSLPNSLHVEWTIRALDAGKHVLCEKPLSRRSADVEAAFDVAERADCVLAEAFMFRHHAQTRRLRELVAGRAIGELALIRACMSFAMDVADDPRTRSELDGGALLDVGCYCVSGARMLAGEPEQVHGVQVIGGDGVDMRFAGTLRFADDVIAQFDCALDQPRRDALEVVGTEGTIELHDPWHCREPSFTLRRAFVVDEVPFPREDPYRLELDDFCRSIRNGTEPLIGRAEAVAQARTLEALRHSAEINQPVSLALVTR